MLPVRTQGAPGPSPEAELPQGKKDADGTSDPYAPIPAPRSKSRRASWLPQPSDAAQNHPPEILNPRGGHWDGLGPKASRTTPKSKGKSASHDRGENWRWEEWGW